jgi:hypothetical protein
MTLVLLFSFAVFCTTHVALVVALLFKEPRWKALLALVPPLAPLAPYWGFRNGLPRYAWLWIVALGVYLPCLIAAYR